MQLIQALDLAGVAVFAATGALAASRRELDLIGFAFLAGVAGIGGGTVRDLILDVPVFWLANQTYVLVCIAIAVAVHFAAPLFESRYTWLLWLDAVGMSAFAVFGAYKGLGVTGSPVAAIVMGILTGTLGGILRDVLAGQPSVLMRGDIYVSAALLGATTFVLADLAGLPLPAATAAGFVLGFALRAGALAYGWTLPRYRSRPGRPPT